MSELTISCRYVVGYEPVGLLENFSKKIDAIGYARKIAIKEKVAVTVYDNMPKKNQRVTSWTFNA